MRFSDRDWGSVFLTETANPLKGLCYLAQIVVTPKSNKRCNIHVYDSTSTADNEIAHIGTANGVTKSVVYFRPFRVHNGIYVLFDGDTVSVQLIFKATFSAAEMKD